PARRRIRLAGCRCADGEDERVPARAPRSLRARVGDPYARPGRSVHLVPSDGERGLSLDHVVELGGAARGLVVLGDHGAIVLLAPEIDAERLDAEVVPNRDPVRPLVRGDLVDVGFLVCSHAPTLSVFESAE